MPSIEKADRNQWAVLWETPRDGSVSVDDFGNPIVVEPVEILVRWEAAKGEGSAKRATIFVGREVTVGSAFWLGRLADLPVPPAIPKGLMQVIKYDETPDLKGRSKRRVVDVVLLGTKVPQTSATGIGDFS